MHISSFAAASSVLGLAAATPYSLWVDNAPTYVRPYVMAHYATGHGVAVGQQIYRFPVTGPSSGGTMTLLSTSAPYSGSLGVSPHIHERHHETFFCLKGDFQLWASKPNTNDNQTQARLLNVGDFGSVPINTTHTFQTLAPDTEMVGVVVPGGFEDLFFFLASSNYSATTDTPYVPAAVSNAAGAGSSASILALLESYDVYGQQDFVPRRDLVNGTAPASNWHTGPNTIPSAYGTPHFIAKDYGSMYMTGKYGNWQIIQPFVLPVTSKNQFTQGSVTISRAQSNGTHHVWNLSNHTAIEVLEGSLSMTIGGQSATLIMGDVAFVPGNTSFSYWSEVGFTKFMYLGAGASGLDQQLMKSASNWSYPVFPTYDA